MKFITGVTNGKVANQERLDEILRSFEGKKIVISIEKWSEKRTTDQNSGLWRWNKILSDETGYTEEEIHYAMCGELYGYKTLNIGGKEIQKPIKTTSNMSTSEFSHHIMLYEIKARELFSINLPPFTYEDQRL
jgi:hypothetical protein